MPRPLLPYFNVTEDGQGMEGLLSFANRSMDYWLLPLFLLVFYSLAIYLATKNEYKLGGQVAFISLLFFLLGMIAQTFTQFNQLIMFAFALGILVGVVMSFIENARS